MPLISFRSIEPLSLANLKTIWFGSQPPLQVVTYTYNHALTAVWCLLMPNSVFKQVEDGVIVILGHLSIEKLWGFSGLFLQSLAKIPRRIGVSIMSLCSQIVCHAVLAPSWELRCWSQSSGGPSFFVNVWSEDGFYHFLIVFVSATLNGKVQPNRSVRFSFKKRFVAH